MMEVVNTIAVMQEECENLRLSGKRIALVPTMGFFHEGHLELMRVGRELSDIMVVSIFVNPTQFGPNEDFESYPHDTESDLAKAEERNVDLVFAPSVDEMYPGGSQTKIMVEKVTKHLCGLSRPEHFNGVTTVVAKLFNIAKPHIAIFGEKDYQQLTVIRRMAKDLDMDIRIVGVPTFREPDGLAMSSRNTRLSKEERKLAPFIYETLVQAREKMEDLTPSQLKEWVTLQFKKQSELNLEYFEIVEDKGLMPIDEWDTLVNKVACLAVELGGVRLIDNLNFD